MGDKDNEVAVGLLVADGKVLLCHRHPARKWYPDVWDLPGGHIEPGESAADALQRELLEELGVHVELVSAEPWRIVALGPSLVLHVWRVHTWHGTVENCAPEEHDDLGWFTADAIGELALAHLSLEPLLREAVRE